jgi:hypothetical protein
MRVKLCARCPYTPRDLAHHYDPEAALYACATCDNGQDLCEIRWRGTCSTEIETSSNAESSVAPFAKGKFGLVRYYCSRTPLCSKKCVDQFKARRDDDTRWLWRFRAA